MNRERMTKLVGAAAACTFAAGIWALFAPPWLGGSTCYVVTSGASMAPQIRSGDLVVARSAAQYRVGDVVVYRSEVLGTDVLHRIVGHDQKRFVTKGDGNSFLDPDRPRPEHLTGKQWLRFPKVGGMLISLRQPVQLALLIAAVALTAMGVAYCDETGGARRRRPPGPPSGTRHGGQPVQNLIVGISDNVLQLVEAGA